MLFPILGWSWEPLKGVWHLFALQHYISVPSAAWKCTLSQWQLGFPWIPPVSSWVKPSQLKSPTRTCRSEPERRSDRSWHTSSPATATAAGATSASNADKLTAKHTRVSACVSVCVFARVLVCVWKCPSHPSQITELMSQAFTLLSWEFTMFKRRETKTHPHKQTHTHTHAYKWSTWCTQFSRLADNLELLLIFNQLSFLLRTFVSQADRCCHSPAVKEKQVPVQQQMDKPQGEKE